MVDDQMTRVASVNVLNLKPDGTNEVQSRLSPHHIQGGIFGALELDQIDR